MTWLWILLAFLSGMLFTYKVLINFLAKVLNRSILLERGLARLSYKSLLSIEKALAKEIRKRQPPNA